MDHLRQNAVTHQRSPEQIKRSLLIDYAIFAAIAFIVMTAFALRIEYFPGDREVTYFLQSFRSPTLDRFMELAGFPGLYPQVIPLNAFIILILYVLRCKWESLTLMIMGPIVGIVSTMLRYSIDRPRPGADLVWVAQEIEKGHYSFPSGHALGFLAIFGFLWYLGFVLLKPSWHRTLLLTAYAALIVLVGVSRVYVGEHWASDVVAGYLAGSVFLALTILFYRSARTGFFERILRHLP